jgi:hypothetical protein
MGIKGPESRVEPIETLSTAPVRIDGLSESLSASVNLDIPDTLILLDSFSPVDVFVQIVEIREEVSLDVEGDPALAELWEIDTEVLTVTLSIPATEVATFSPEGIYFGFDAASVGIDGSVIPIIVGLPESFEVLEFSPQTIVAAAIP